MNMPKFYWAEAVKSAVYLINRTPSGVIDFQTPQQKMQSLLSIPHLPNLEPRIFGCTAYVHIPKALRTKLHPSATKCVFIGYSDFQKGYRCYDPQTHKLHVTLDVSFHESEPYYLGGAFAPSLQGENVSEKNSKISMLQENDIGNEFSELEDISDRLGLNNSEDIQSSC